MPARETERLRVLGCMLDIRGDPGVSLDYRLAVARVHLAARMPALRRRGVQFGRRLDSFHAGTATCALWGSQGWGASASTLVRLKSFELQSFRRMLGRKRRPYEQWLHFFRRTSRHARHLLVRMARP